MKRLSLPPDAIARARRLRRDLTEPERLLWRGLRSAFPDLHFRKQVPFGIYTVDFACHSARLIIEVDGSQHGTDSGIAKDALRTQFLENEGYRVLRFWNGDVLRNLSGVIDRVALALAPTPRPPHKGEGGFCQPPVGV